MRRRERENYVKDDERDPRKEVPLCNYWREGLRNDNDNNRKIHDTRVFMFREKREETEKSTTTNTVDRQRSLPAAAGTRKERPGNQASKSQYTLTFTRQPSSTTIAGPRSHIGSRKGSKVSLYSPPVEDRQLPYSERNSYEEYLAILGPKERRRRTGGSPDDYIDMRHTPRRSTVGPEAKPQEKRLSYTGGATTANGSSTVPDPRRLMKKIGSSSSIINKGLKERSPEKDALLSANRRSPTSNSSVSPDGARPLIVNSNRSSRVHPAVGAFTPVHPSHETSRIGSPIKSPRSPLATQMVINRSSESIHEPPTTTVISNTLQLQKTPSVEASQQQTQPPSPGKRRSPARARKGLGGISGLKPLEPIIQSEAVKVSLTAAGEPTAPPEQERQPSFDGNLTATDSGSDGSRTLVSYSEGGKNDAPKSKESSKAPIEPISEALLSSPPTKTSLEMACSPAQASLTRAFVNHAQSVKKERSSIFGTPLGFAWPPQNTTTGTSPSKDGQPGSRKSIWGLFGSLRQAT